METKNHQNHAYQQLLRSRNPATEQNASVAETKTFKGGAAVPEHDATVEEEEEEDFDDFFEKDLMQIGQHAAAVIDGAVGVVNAVKTTLTEHQVSRCAVDLGVGAFRCTVGTSRHIIHGAAQGWSTFTDAADFWTQEDPAAAMEENADTETIPSSSFVSRRDPMSLTQRDRVAKDQTMNEAILLDYSPLDSSEHGHAATLRSDKMNAPIPPSPVEGEERRPHDEVPSEEMIHILESEDWTCAPEFIQSPSSVTGMSDSSQINRRSRGSCYKASDLVSMDEEAGRRAKVGVGAETTCVEDDFEVIDSGLPLSEEYVVL